MTCFIFSIWVETTNLFASWFYRLLLNWLIHSYQVGGVYLLREVFNTALNAPHEAWAWSKQASNIPIEKNKFRYQSCCGPLNRCSTTSSSTTSSTTTTTVHCYPEVMNGHMAFLAAISVSTYLSFCFGGFGECSEKSGDGNYIRCHPWCHTIVVDWIKSPISPKFFFPNL